MAREGAAYSAFNGSKLEYSTSENGDYTQIYGLKTIPDIGGTPNQIDTTDLDNTEYETAINGLKPAQQYEFEFNMEDTSVTANIKLASDLEDAGTKAYWKLTLTNGVVVSFQSDVKTTINGGSSGDLIGFTMTLAPIAEPVVTINTTSL